MITRLEALAVRKYKTREGEEKSSWTNIGVAFQNKDGKSYSLMLHCIPAPDPETGEFRIQLREPLPKDEGRF